jgi:hypothetical protein
VKIQVVTPAPLRLNNGNKITAVRWSRILRGLGHKVDVVQRYAGASCDLMIALHARRSHKSILTFHELHPDLPLVVVLTGTDVYRPEDGSFVFQQWIKYKHQALRYQLEINDNIYFRNQNNNAGIFDYLIGAAEEQEYKEALLAYFFLMGEPLDERALDARIEAWLDAHFDLKVDFDVKDGLAKLERLGLLTRNDATLSVAPLSEALARLDRRWDGLFRFSEAAE